MSRSRTVTVLVADMVDSTEMFGRLGVDRADDARRALFAVFSTVIGAGDGVLIKTMGDGCLASFGSAADAVSAAVAIQQAVAGLRERKVPGLGLRVGVAVGDVTEEDGDVFGPAVVTAGRLCSAAGEHQVLATDMVRMLAGDRGGHHFEAVGELILKGSPGAGGRLHGEGRCSGDQRAVLPSGVGGDTRGAGGRSWPAARPC